MRSKSLDDAAYQALMADEMNDLRARINGPAVCKLASSLNAGKPCVLEHPSKVVGLESLTGCANYHARVRFEDGSPAWLLRVPRVTGFAVGLPSPLAEYLIQSEFATLKFLETTKVPAPRAFSFGIPSQGTDRGVGVCFLLMEELAGRPWDGTGDTSKVWQRLGEILAELEKHKFHQAGSLCVESPQDQPSVSAAASDRFVCLDPWGPFETATEYYSAWAEQHLALIVDGQLYPQFPVEAFLVYRFLKKKASTLADGDDSFFLRHVDDKGDHLLVDEQTNIIGIVDWQMARVVPRREAFALSLISADMRALCNGQVSLSAMDVALANALREKNAQLAECMGDEKMRRFFWGLGLEHDWTFAFPLAKAILQVFGVEKGWDEWREEQLRDCERDERLTALLEVC
ncbi:Aminoglycoside phosphotransferase [Moelleriella libera RCEF 2490]|uniref:Aminoglycoside phosphotransferase n=1 Tax=Moelleriella libera RCEF 2490 TaxID=1081109 RepID=A0A166V799_9HYPO|nr:Aminoglycoside phosphotransferase [Moelleriella libera RCEF 2490]